MNKPAGLLGFALDNLPLVVLTGRCIQFGAPCHGCRDRRGRPTQSALDANAAMQTGPHGQGRTVLWNRTVCSELLEQKGYEPMSRSLQVEQWTQLLEALQVGSPSITATADQMAEEMPGELLEDVNHQLAARGCRYRVSPRSLHARH